MFTAACGIEEVLNAVIGVYNGIASNDGLPDEIIFHCGGGWAAAMNRRLTTYGYKSHGTMDCSDPYDV